MVQLIERRVEDRNSRFYSKSLQNTSITTKLLDTSGEQKNSGAQNREPVDEKHSLKTKGNFPPIVIICGY